MEFFDLLFDAFEYVRQVPEPLRPRGANPVFVRTEARSRTTDLETNEQWTHLVTVRDGKLARLEQFRNRDDALEAAGLFGVAGVAGDPACSGDTLEGWSMTLKLASRPERSATGWSFASSDVPMACGMLDSGAEWVFQPALAPRA
jgi:hypothetical protein